MSPTPTFIEDVKNNDGSPDNVRKKVFPYKIEPVPDDKNQELLKYFTEMKIVPFVPLHFGPTGEKTQFLQVGPKKWIFPSGYEREAHNYYNFVARPDDVFIVTFPRSGTTWTQELVWLLANNLDYQKAAEIPLVDRFPFLEFSAFVHKETKAIFLEEQEHDLEKYRIVQDLDYPAWKLLEDRTERRFIKTHLPFTLLPSNLLDIGCKVIYVARNPKDIAVSYFHLNRLYRTQGYIGDFSKFWNFFERDLVPWAPYWQHIEEGWTRRHEDNLLFLFYEDMNKDLRSGIKVVAEFLDIDYKDEQYDILENHLKIDTFRKNKSVNNEQLRDLGILLRNEHGFVRKGKNGGWKDYFDDGLDAQANKWIAEHLKYTDFRFPKDIFLNLT